MDHAVKNKPGHIASDTHRIDSSAWIDDTVLGEHIEIGPWVKLSKSRLDDYTYVMDRSDIIYTQTGKFCSIASHVRINPGQHPLSGAALHHFTYRSRQYGMREDDADFFKARQDRQVTLGHDVWIGHGAVIMPGITIGTGAVIGSNAVVTKDVPGFAIMAGVPARILRFRFEKNVQDQLLKIGWWHWSHDRISAALEDFRQMSAQEFVIKYNSNAALTLS